MKRGLLFDLDGTLWDACRVMADSWTACIHEYWPAYDRVFTVAQMYGACGKTMDDFSRYVMPDLPDELRIEIGKKCAEYEVEYMKEHCGELYPGLAEAFNALAEAYHLYVVSNCQEGYIENFVALSGVGHLVEDIESFGRTGLKKYENIQLLMQRNGLEQAVYVGDTRLDRKSADLAGIPFIHARYGFEEPIPDVPWIDSLPELPERASQVFAAYDSFVRP